MVQLTKKQIRKDLIENLGQIFFEERKIGKIIRLITFYNKKLKVEMTN